MSKSSHNKRQRSKTFSQKWRHLILAVIAIIAVTTFNFTAAPTPTSAAGIPVIDAVTNASVQLWGAVKQAFDKGFEAWQKFEKQIEKQTKTAAAVAFKNVVKAFTRQLAHDTAVWIASGGQGQQPLFVTQGWGAYLRDAGDAAVGNMLTELSKPTTYKTEYLCTCGSNTVTVPDVATCTASGAGCKISGSKPSSTVDQQGGILEGFNVCQPDLRVGLRINLGLTPYAPTRPKCRMSTLLTNWEQSIQRASFLPDFQRTFEPAENPLGIALILNEQAMVASSQAQKEAENERLQNRGFLDYKDKAGNVKTPGSTVADWLNMSTEKGSTAELTFTGEIVADAIDTFTNTLIGNFLNNVLKNGLGGSSSKSSRAAANRTITNPEADVSEDGAEAAQIRFAQDISPSLGTPGRYDVLSELVSCPNPTNPGPSNCVIKDNFRTAINQRLTVKEAVDKGLINADGPFGFVGWEPQPIEPSYTDGIPYRSILILRKYRIVPVGWELAARYIEHFDKTQRSLNELMKLYNESTLDGNPNPYYHLVDPNWVFVAPDAYCKLRGPGPQIISSQVTAGVDINKDGKYDGEGEQAPDLVVNRNENYCADEQTCIKKDDKGVCQFYGYCTDEQRIWDFGANSCKPVYNTCTTLTNKSSGTSVSYLLNSVDFDSCNEQSSGCKQYSTYQKLDKPINAIDRWTMDYNEAAAPDNSSSIYLNSKAGACTSENAGCRAYAKTGIGLPTPTGVNLNSNPSFEFVSNTIPSCPSIALKIDGGFDGDNYCLLSSGVGGSISMNKEINLGDNTIRDKTIGGATFTLSFYARNASGGSPIVSFTPSQSNVISALPILSDEWQRYIVKAEYPTSETSTKIAFAINAPSANSMAIDAVKLELGSEVTSYTPYGVGVTDASIHLKRAPDYLQCFARDDEPIECPRGGGDCNNNQKVTVDELITGVNIALGNSTGDPECLRAFDKNDSSTVTIDELIFAINNALTGVQSTKPITDLFDEYIAGNISDAEFTSQMSALNAQELSCAGVPIGPDSPNCQPYARYCKAEEVGCLRYTPTLGGAPITSVRGDVCPAECVGYDTYTQAATFFEPTVDFEDLIPSTARKCSATAVGCDEFTNLDIEAEGGESKEYYQQIRYCQKSSTDDGVYYTWEGSDTTGFQLKVFELKKTQRNLVADPFDTPGEAPCTQISLNADGTSTCVDDDPTISPWVCGQEDLGANPDCRQFYDESGNISYRLFSHTISVADNCRPYRKSESVEPDCEASNGYWNDALSACIYQAVPGQGLRCSASAAGCREYRGGASANYKNIFSDNFEKDSGNWSGGQLSPVASAVGGHSYKLNANTTISKNLAVTSGSTNSSAFYVLSFWAKPQSMDSSPTIKATFSYGSPVTTINIIPKTSATENFRDGWQYYQSDPIALGVKKDGKINITVANTVAYIDNITLKSNVSTYYLIKNSWRTPDSCKTPTAPNNMLGCQTFKVSDGATRNIWQFGDSCPDKEVGCEALIDTQNSTQGDDAPFAKIYGRCQKDATIACSQIDANSDGIDDDCGAAGPCDVITTVPADKIDFLVNDSKKSCEAATQGCEALGVPIYGSDGVIKKWQENPIYLLNNPDDYLDSLCAASQLQCSVYEDGNGHKLYFKDPGNKTCRYREDVVTPGWYYNVCQSISGVSNNVICDADTDCSSGYTCKPKSCDSSALLPRTLASHGVKEPQSGFVGVCATEQNSCSEYIDPRSDTQTNLVKNGAFFDIDNNDLPDYWQNTSTLITPQDYDSDNPQKGVKVKSNSLWQTVDGLQNNQLYIISAEVKSGGASETAQAMIGIKNCTSDSAEINNVPLGLRPVEFSLGQEAFATFKAPSAEFTRFSAPFYAKISDGSSGEISCDIVIGTANMLTGTYNNTTVGTYISGTATNGHWFRNVSLRPADVYYKLANNVDTSNCTNVDNVSCALFNERSVSAGRYVDTKGALAYEAIDKDADTSINSIATPVEDNMCNRRCSNDAATTCTKNSHCTDAAICTVGEACVCEARPTCANVISSTGKHQACVSDQDCTLALDSNTLIKVTPDRQCSAWLSCRTARNITENGVTKKLCLDLQGCQALDEKGNCISPLLTDTKDKNLTYSSANVDSLQNRSGYSKVGFDWGVNASGNREILQGYLPTAYMSSTSTSVSIVNNNFEASGDSDNPTGWQNNQGYLRVIDNPVEAEKLDINYPMEGKKFLEVNANTPVAEVTPPAIPTVNTSNTISVASNTSYIISAYINTQHFIGDSVEVRIYPNDGAPLGSYHATLNLGPGFGWTLLTDKFTTGASTTSIKLQLNSDPSGVTDAGFGLWYIDDINIRPALQYQNNEAQKLGLLKVCRLNPSQNCSADADCTATRPSDKCDYYVSPDFAPKSYERGLETIDYHYAPQSCRIYPEADAPSCRYYDEKGLRHTGRSGYCLEWDPQNPNYCLQWWPVDSVMGEDLSEERIGYNDRVPLYYCVESVKNTSEINYHNFPQRFRPHGTGDGNACTGGINVEGVTYTYTDNVCSDTKKPCSVSADCTAPATCGPETFEQDAFPTGAVRLEVPDAQKDKVPNAVCIKFDLNSTEDVGGCSNATRICGSHPQICNEDPNTINGVCITSEHKISRGEQVGGVELDWPDNPEYTDLPYYKADIHPDAPIDESKYDVWSLEKAYLAGDVPNADTAPYKDSGDRFFNVFVVINKNSGLIDHYFVKAHFSGEDKAYYLQTRVITWECNKIIQTVNHEGLNKSATTRLNEKSFYMVQSPLNYARDTYLAPFGGVVPPEPFENPTSWTKKLQVSSSLPSNAGSPYGCSGSTAFGASCPGGQDRDLSQAITSLKELFVQSYGIWKWIGNTYTPDSTTQDLEPPTTTCPGTPPTRPSVGPLGCVIAPQIPLIKLNNSTGPVIVKDIGSVILSFTAVADPDQEPIVSYTIDWGDGSTPITQSGLHMQSKPSEQNAISLSHVYTYGEVASCYNDYNAGPPATGCRVRAGMADGACSSSSCTIKPRVKIIDNWGSTSGLKDGPTITISR